MSIVLKMDTAAAKQKLLEEMDTLRDPRGFIKAGLPRFDRLFGRDSLIVSWQLLDTDPTVAKATLEALAKPQGTKIDHLHEEEPGKIIHETDDKPHPEHPETFPFPYYGSVDSTPLFIVVGAMYFEKTGDRQFLKRIWPNIKAAANWIMRYGDADGDTFLEYERKGKGLIHQGWKDGTEDHLKIRPPAAIVEAQGYAYLALKQTAKLADILGESGYQPRLAGQADRLKENFNRRFWMEDEQFFALALDGGKDQRTAVTSNPGHLLFTGVVDEKEIEPIVKRLFAPDLWTPYGIRTHSRKEPDFDPLSYHLGSIWPHDNWVIAQGLKKIGADKEYDRVREAILKAYQELGRAPELYGVKDGKLVEVPGACHLQAWAAGAVLNFLQ